MDQRRHSSQDAAPGTVCRVALPRAGTCIGCRRSGLNRVPLRDPIGRLPSYELAGGGIGSMCVRTSHSVLYWKTYSLGFTTFLVSQLVRVVSRLPWFVRCSLHAWPTSGGGGVW